MYSNIINIPVFSINFLKETDFCRCLRCCTICTICHILASEWPAARPSWYLCKSHPSALWPSLIVLVYLTITWGAAARTASVAMMVNSVKVMRQSLSRTMAANFQSPSTAADSSSSRILSVITFISFRIRLSSRGTPDG